MARKNRNLSNAFERFSNTKTEKVTVPTKQLHETEIVNVTSKSNNKNVSENVIQLSNTSKITKDVTVNSTVDITNGYCQYFCVNDHSPIQGSSSRVYSIVLVRSVDLSV